ncbi:sodium/potassium-transporting ATPase subunit beta [Culicoides brevitarsis]|uniref:sodium/potassium-transporting ATPase subunit beta n=1 Tax=Culicoides brevitarsis TaxID=469753 RepID=UPI00307BB2DA
MADKKQVEQQYYSRPPKLGKWEGFKQFLWNSETSQFMGRTGSSWAKILFFYVCFYACLIGFFAGLLAVFYQTLDYKMPKWQLDNGLIGANPGLGFRPMPPESNVESTLIWFKHSDAKNTKYWVDEVNNFLKPYREAAEKKADNRVECSFDNPPTDEKVCNINIDKFDQCTPKHNYSYPKGKPCVFLKLNKIYNWRPTLYNNSKELPEKMPQHLKTFIESEERRGGANSKNTNMVWISCEGENPADVENIGSIQYIPRRGFPSYYFPYLNQPDYLPPLIAIYFENPKQGVLINIECKAWARNIHHDRTERRGSVHFELMVD